MKCRKLLAILLALVMVIGLLPFAALAEEVPGSSPGDEVSDNLVADQNDPLPEGDPLGTDPEGEPQDEPLPEGDPLGEQPPEVSLLNDEHHAGATALKSTDSALSDGSYYLSKDVKLNKPVTFSGTATLCLNGHKLSCGSDKVIMVNGTLTICDCASGGKIEATDRANFVINVGIGKTLNVEGGTICGGYRGISGSLNSEINISGGTIQKSASSTYKALELNGTTATITDGTITGGVELKSSSNLSLGGPPTVDTIKLTHDTCSINATADSKAYSGGPITIDYGNLDYSDGTAIVSGVTAENAESFIVTPPEGMEVKFENGNLVFGDPASNPGHSHEDDDPSVTWTELTAQDRQLTSGHYYLGNDITVNKTTDQISITGDVTLCLNDYALTSSVAQISFISVENGGSLTLCDCGNGGKVESLCNSICHVIDVEGGGSCTIKSGMISGIDDTLNGETIRVESGGSLTLNGGTVTGSTGIYNQGTTTVSGGTVACDKYGIHVGGHYGVVNMESGSVSATGSDGVSGIYMNYGSLVMTGGTVSGTTYGIALQTADEEKSFVISDGTITGGYGIYFNSEKCKSPLYLTGKPTLSTLHLSKPTTLIFASKDGSPYSGNEITVSLGSGEEENAVIISGISNNADRFTYAGENFVLKEDGKDNLILKTPTTAPEHANHGVNGGSGSQPWTAWDGTSDLAADGHYYLADNVTLTETIQVRGDVHLCLNGKTLASTADYAVEVTEDHALTICDCGEGGSIERTHESGYLNGCAVLVRGDFTLYGGSLKNHGNKGYGILVMVPGGGSRATIEGGSVYSDVNAIQVNTASDVTLSGGQVYGKKSGVVLADDDISFTMTGGSVTAENERGITTSNYDITLSISDGTIRGGDAGIRLLTTSGGGTTISGGTITSKEGVGIDQKDLGLSGWGEEGNEATLILTGAPEIQSLRLEVASKVNGKGYTGEVLDVAFVKDDAADDDIVIVGTTDLEKFNLTDPADKILVAQGGNLVLGEKTVEVPKLVLSALPETVTYGDTFTLTATGGGEGALIWAATGAASVDEDGTVTITGAGSFTITATKGGKEATATGTAAQKAVTITAKAQTIAYGASIATGTGQVTVTGLVSGDSLRDITLSASDTAITPSGAAIEKNGADVTDNYTISYVSGVLTVTGQPQEGFAVTGDPESVTYGDTFKLDTTGGSGEGAVTWTATGAASVDEAGNVTITGVGSFTITATKAGDDTYAEATATYQATAQKRALTIAANDATIAFNAAAPAYTASVTGAMPADETAIAGAYTLSCDYAPGDAVGDYTITVTANLTPDLTAKYDLTTTNGTLHVTKAAAEVTTAPTAKTDLVYTGTAQALVTAGTATGGTMVYSLSENGTYAEAIPEGTNAGAYTVWYKVKGDGNHSDTAPQSIPVSIGKAKLTVKANDLSINEGSPVPTYTAAYAGFVNGQTEAVLSGKLTFTCSYTQNSKPGTYPITPSGLTSDNYAITFQNGTLTVVAVGEILPPVAKDLTYTGKAQKLIDPAQAADDVDLFYSLDLQHFYRTIPEATNAGTYTVYWEAEKDGTTVDNGSLTVTIKKAPLTVTADDIWVYAGNTPKFTVTITGYVNGEDWRELGGKLTFTCGYSEKYSKPGSRYTITPKGLRADNYDITFETGILTVKDPLSPRFNVYVLDSKHGTVEADCRYARKGDVVTLTIKPDWGYELETLTVTDSHGYELKLTYHSNDTYTFTMPRDNVTVKAIFTVRDMPFVDVPGDAWYAGGVRYVYAHGLMNGTGSWRFSPNRTTTRAMIATILYRMEGSPRVYGTSQFGDVEAGSWYEDAVIWATQNDIVEGYTSKTFGPNDPITREQMAAMLYRYADYCRCDMSAGRYVDLSKYSDMNEISDYAIPALRWAVGEEIIQGRTGKRLAPTDTATRAEVAVMLMRFCEDVIW